jgi:outer membrane protein
MERFVSWARISAGASDSGAHERESTKARKHEIASLKKMKHTTWLLSWFLLFSCFRVFVFSCSLLFFLAPVLHAQARQGRALTLDEALEIASKESETIGIARAGIESARGEQRRARSEFFPQLSGSASYTRTLETQFAALSEEDGASGGTPAPTSCPAFVPDPAATPDERLAALEEAAECSSTVDPFGAFSDLPFGQPNQWSFGLSLSQNLFAGGRILAQNRIASANRRGAETELTAQQAQLVVDVTTAYYDAVLSDRLVSIAEASLEQSERTLKDVRLAREVGTLPEFDLLRAEVSRNNQRPAVIQRRASRELAYLRLAQLLNLSMDEPLVLTTSLGDTTEVPVPSAIPIAVTEASADTTIEDRAPVRQASENVRASEGQLAVSRSQSLPSVVLSSQYAKLNFPEEAFPSGRFLTDWTIGVSLRLPLFTGGRLGGERIIARAGVDQARLRLRQVEEQARLDARNTRANAEEAEARWSATTGTVRQAQRAYEIAEIRYREGISTQTELSDSRLQLQDAQANRAQAARDLQVARVRLALIKDLPLPAASGALVSRAPTAAVNVTPAPSAPPAGSGASGVRTTSQ